MVSQLGPLFRTMFRQAESADARLEIRREEKEHRKKRDEADDESAENDAMWEDSTTVSIEALRSFLIDFLKSHGADAPQETVSLAAQDMPPPEQRPPVSSVAARAAKAYGAFTPAPPPVIPHPDSVSTEEQEADPAALLPAAEIRAIHTLIADLEALAAGGQTTLSFKMTGTFLESLAAAVRERRQNS